MGNDGGTIPSRREILALDSNKKVRQESQRFIDKSNRQIHWTYCKLKPSEKLDPSQVVSDYKGNFFNKTSVLEYLLSRKKLTKSQDSGSVKKGEEDKENSEGDKGDKFLYIRSINDIVEIPNFQDIKDKDDIEYCYLVPCGHLNNLSLIKEITQKSDFLQCPVCNIISAKRDVVKISSDISNEKRFQELEAKHLYHNTKAKKKKSKKRSVPDADKKCEAGDKRRKV